MTQPSIDHLPLLFTRSLPLMPSTPFPLNAIVQGTGFPVLCLHGHPGSGQSMSVFTQFLSQQFQTISPDLRGYGRSRPATPFTMEDHLTDLVALLDRYQIDQCLVLGWSLGGILAMELALRHPERVTGLILVATSARPWGNHPKITWQDNLFTGIAGIFNWLKPSWQWNIETFGKRSLFRYLIQQHTPVAYRYLAREALPAYLQTSRVATRALYQAIGQGYNRLVALEAIQFPVLMLMGEHDRHITAASSQETVQALMNVRAHCYPNTAHLFPWEIPGQVRQDIERWLIDHPVVTQSLFSNHEQI